MVVIIFIILDFIISAIKSNSNSVENLTNEELFDFGFILQNIQKLFESYFKIDSTNIIIINGFKNSATNFHCHFIMNNNNIKGIDSVSIESGNETIKNTNLFDNIYDYIYKFEASFDSISLNNDTSDDISLVENIQNYIFNSTC